MKIKLQYLLFYAFFILLSSCNKTTDKNDGPVDVKADQMNVAVYPHEKDFFKGHGTTYLANKVQCLGCHGKDGSGGTAKVSCTQCHEVFPHVNFLSIPDQHGAAYAKNPQACSKCHGDDWQGGKTGVSCLKCHENFPHPKQWATPDQHGKAFVAQADKQQCLACHNADRPEVLATRCDTCHKAFPHDSKFVMGNKSHKLLATSYEGKCLSCHRDYKDNMPNNQDPDEGIGCFSCHSGKIGIHWEDDAPKPPQGATGKLMKKSERIPSSSPHKKLKDKKIKKKAKK